MPDLADLLVELSSATSRILDDADDAGFSPREETITEQLLLELYRKAPGQVRTYKMSPHEEARNGADLAAAIEVSPGLWLSLILQAKKLDNRSGRYKELRKAEALSQSLRLLGVANDWMALAAYVFYNGRGLRAGDSAQVGGCTRKVLTRSDSGPPWRTGNRAKASAKGCSPLGLTVMAADAVRDVLTASGSVDGLDLLRESAPLECILCPFGTNGGGRPAVIPWPEWAASVGKLSQGIDVAWLREAPPTWASHINEGVAPDDAPDVTFLVSVSQPT